MFIFIQENTQTKDEEILKEHVNELRDKLRSQHLQQEDELEQYRQREENVRKTLLMLQDKHKQEVHNFCFTWLVGCYAIFNIIPVISLIEDPWVNKPVPRALHHDHDRRNWRSNPGRPLSNH